MKRFVIGIILGIVSILSSLLFTGIPVSTAPFGLISLAVFILGALLVLFFGPVKRTISLRL